MISFLFLLDVPPSPQRLAETHWGLLMLVLAIVFILAVGLAGGLAVLLIRFKRRKLKEAEDGLVTPS